MTRWTTTSQTTTSHEPDTGTTVEPESAEWPEGSGAKFDGPPPTDRLRPTHRIYAPLADRLRRVRRSRTSFHALPWSGGAALEGSPLRETYRELFGEQFMDIDVSYSGGILDSFFRPTGPLDHAQHLAAEAFGSDYTFFITCGTTTANRIAVESVTGRSSRALLDPTAHQSLFFALSQQGIDLQLIPTTTGSIAEPTAIPDLSVVPAVLAAAKAVGRPFDVVALSAGGYDGARYRMDELLPDLVAASPQTALLVDEAWTAAHAFHPDLRRHTTLTAARALLAGTRPTVLVTHSAHKSLCAARQGSYLHVLGDRDAVHRVQDALFRSHTTSPSWPVLASLDLARAHGQQHGETLLERALGLARHFRSAVAADPALRGYRLVEPRAAESQPMVVADPLRVRLDRTDLGSGKALRSALFDDYGIHLGRSTQQGILMNFHMGVTPDGVERLLDALGALAVRNRRVSREQVEMPTPGDTSDSFYVAYPPGIPTVRPGQLWQAENTTHLAAECAGGAELFRIPATRLLHPVTAPS